MIQDTKIRIRYEKLTKLLIKNSLTVSTMESMTGGMIASLITDTPGASATLKGAYVAYCNDAKIQLGVDKDIIVEHGVYSLETARGMAEVCKKAFNTDIGIGITGTAGNVDENNMDSVAGEAYICISYAEEYYEVKLEMGRQKSRYEYKICVAEKIADMFEKIIA